MAERRKRVRIRDADHVHMRFVLNDHRITVELRRDQVELTYRHDTDVRSSIRLTNAQFNDLCLKVAQYRRAFDSSDPA